MSIIESQIDQKIDVMNDNGKIHFLLKILQHCLQCLPNLEKVSLEELTDQIDQLTSMVKYILLIGNTSLKSVTNEQIEAIRELQDENGRLANEASEKKNSLHIPLMEKEGLLELIQI